MLNLDFNHIGVVFMCLVTTFFFVWMDIYELKIRHLKPSNFKKHMVTSKGHQTLVMDGEFIEGFHMITLKHVTIVTPPY
jgi:hypothetical protein